MLVRILDRYYMKKIIQKYKEVSKELNLDLGFYTRKGELLLFIKPKEYKETYYQNVATYKIKDCFYELVDKDFSKKLSKSINETIKVFQK